MVRINFVKLCLFTVLLPVGYGHADDFWVAPPKNEITSQLASIISYPKILYYQDRSGIVVIQFILDEARVIGQVKVFSQIDAINTDLVRQLTGKKINVSTAYVPYEIYTVKIYFKME